MQFSQTNSNTYPINKIRLNELHQFERDLKANGNKIVVENEESEEGIGEIARWKS